MYTQNPDIEAILKAKEENQLVVFIGAGISANSGLPSWSELVTEFANKLGINRALTSEDYLRVPQYFYNERGQLEYNQVIEKVFSGQYIPNDIHDQILLLKPKHIITTNYDNLIEQSLEKHYLFYNNVFEDKDLPYANNNRLFIKMHGDLVKKNFVLKEDDYLNYSRNFRLIENYIESIFINHTVLFVGYSVQDYDLKLILKRIQSTLGQDHRKAYLISSSTSLNDFEKNYFKKFGINIIDSNCVPEKDRDASSMENSHGAATFNILNFIDKYQLDNKESLTYLSKKWAPFKSINALRIQELMDQLNLKNLNYECIFGDLRIYFTNRQEENFNLLTNFIKELNKIKEDLSNNIKNNLEGDYKNVIDVLSKAAVKKITITDPPNTVISFQLDYREDEWKPDILKYIEENNYIELENIITKISSKYPNFNYEDNLSLSYALIHFNKFVSANKQLKNISLRAYKERKYSMYYFASFNKLLLERLLKSFGMYLTGNLSEPISEEDIRKLNFEKIRNEIDESFKQFKSSELEDLKFLENLVSSKGLLSDLRNQSRVSLEQIKDDYTKKWFPGSESNNLAKLISAVYDFYRYTSYNLIISNYYNETKEIYTNYFEAICCTYTNVDKKEDGLLSPYELTEKDLIIITNCLSQEEIQKILKKYKIDKLYLKNNETIYATMILSNIISSYGYFRNSRNIENRLCSTLELFKVFEFKVDELENFLRNFNGFIVKRPIRDTVYISFLSFLSQRTNSLHIDCNLYIEFLQKYIEKLCNAEFNKHKGFEMDLLEDWNFSESLFELISINKAAKINLNTDNLFKELDFGYLKRIKKEIYILLLNVTPVSEKDFKKQMKKRIKNLLKENFEIDIFLKAISLNIFVPDKDLINNFKQSLRSVEQYKIINFINHANNNKPNIILNIIKKSSNLYSFLIDQNSYDYNKNDFNIQWIHYLKEEQLINLNGSAYQHIEKVLIAKIIEDNYKNQPLNELYLKFFKA